MEHKHQVVVLGAGPAGLNAAKYAANAGCDVALIDSGKRLGGQYWRHTGVQDFDQSLHDDFDSASLLVDAVRANPRITICSDTSIWSASILDEQIILRTKNGAFITQRLVLATGAYDRTIPFPGWDIPGVMTAGAAQSLLKGSGVIAGKKIVVAGTGPFLLPVAAALSTHGAESVELYEATPWNAWLSQLHILLQNPSKIFGALGYFKTLRNNKVKMQYRGAVVAAHADDSGLLKSVTIAKIDSNYKVLSEREVPCDVVAISYGFTPDIALAASLSLKAKVASDGSTFIEVDAEQRATTLDAKYQIFAAGELTGVGGSDLALVEGAIAGLAAAGSSQNKKTLLKLRRRSARFAQALLKVYPVPNGWKGWLKNDTTICRCEEVDYQEFLEAGQVLGASDARTMKLMTRCGMGMCQGRICSRNIFDLLQSSEEDRIRGSQRPIITPITLGELAQEGLL